MQEFFSTYTQACKRADDLLFSLGKPNMVDTECRESEVGKLTPTALYVHESALESLSPLLRLFEGCARTYIGRVEGANLIKLHRLEPKISYLSYPEFESDPHPALAHSLSIHLQTFRMKTREYRDAKNPPILHRKETFLSPHHPDREKFARLTQAEERKGLYEDTARIGTRGGWNAVLAARRVRLKGHRLLNI